MVSIKFSDEEQRMLKGEQLYVRIIYWAIRCKMDFETGVAGGISGVNIIDNLYFHEELRVDPIPGRSKEKIETYSRGDIRSALKRLEKKGLIRHRGNFIFECLLAERDKSDQKSWCPAGARATTTKNTSKPLKNKKKPKEQQPTSVSSWYPPPVSGITLDTDVVNITSLPLDASYHQQTEKKSVHKKIMPIQTLSEEKTSDGCDKKNIKFVREVFEYWQKRLNHGLAKLDGPRKRKIQLALKLGYTVEQLKLAIDGCAKSAWHQGRNETGAIYDGITLILRNSENIEKFININQKENGPTNAPHELTRAQKFYADHEVRRSAMLAKLKKQEEDGTPWE